MKLKTLAVYSALMVVNASVVSAGYSIFTSLAEENRKATEAQEEVLIFEDLEPAMQTYFNEDLNFPIVASPRPFPRPDSIHDRCMALNIYHEARGEGLSGQKRVGFVTLNRVNHRRWADNVCGVVYENAQFSWTLFDKKINFSDPNQSINFHKAYELAVKIRAGEIEDNSGGADHYYAIEEMKDKKKPKWASSMQLVVVDGGHTFLRD